LTVQQGVGWSADARIDGRFILAGNRLAVVGATHWFKGAVTRRP